MASLTHVITEDTAATTEIDLTAYVDGSMSEITAADIRTPDDEAVSLTVVDADDPEEVDGDEIALVSDTSVVLGRDVDEATIMVIASDLFTTGTDEGGQSTPRAGDERAL